MALSDRELLRLLPKVLRARDFHLYLEGGKRLVDLWLEGGRAVLGHKPPRVLSEMKNAAERGLFIPLPHPLERRLIKALEVFFPGRSFRLYRDESSLFLALEKAGFSGQVHDPAFASKPVLETGKAGVSLWRPFLDKEGEDEANAAILIPVLPWSLGPAILVLDKSLESSFSPGELIPPVLLAPTARALYDLAAALNAFTSNRPQYPKIEKVLKGGLWRRRGIYITGEPRVEGEKYAALFKRLLEGEFLIPPSPREPIILPLSMSKGEESKLAEMLSG